jgi:hypothetical protein
MKIKILDIKIAEENINFTIGLINDSGNQIFQKIYEFGFDDNLTLQQIRDVVLADMRDMRDKINQKQNLYNKVQSLIGQEYNL